MGLSTHIIRRLLLVIPMLIGVTLLTFVVSRVVPVDPLAVIVSERLVASRPTGRAAVTLVASGGTLTVTGAWLPNVNRK